jgi:large subunit ribosomal protein L21
MFAIVKTGGKQYKVAQNDKINVEKIEAKEGDKITLDSVLFVSDEKGEVTFGDPEVKGATIEAEVLSNFRDKKVIIFKKRRRQNSRTKNGHRQSKTELKILNIKVK